MEGSAATQVSSARLVHRGEDGGGRRGADAAEKSAGGLVVCAWGGGAGHQSGAV